MKDNLEVIGSEQQQNPHQQILLAHITRKWLSEEELTQNVEVEANECYSSITVPVPADQDDLFEYQYWWLLSRLLDNYACAFTKSFHYVIFLPYI